MNVTSEFSPETTVAPVPARLAPPLRSMDETATLGIAFGVFADVMEGKVAKMALTACKVLLFNFFLFAPIVALLYLIFVM